MKKYFASSLKIVPGIGVLLLLTATPLTPALAATVPAGGQALEIAPPIITLTVSPGQTIHTNIKLRDITGGNLLVTNQINDFVANGEDGTPKILLDGDADNKFSVKNWIQAVPSMTLKPQEIRTVDIVINVPANASPGGHYGVIRFTGIPPELSGQGVSLAASLGALIMLTVTGQISHNLSLASFSAAQGGHSGTFFESAPLDIVERIKNTGNVQEQPAGTVIVTDMFGRTIAGLPVNAPPHSVLPDSIRKFTQSLDKSVLGNRRLFGHYKATLKLAYGTAATKPLNGTFTFWVIPYKLIIAVVVLIIGGFFVLRFLIRRYNRFIISKVQGGSQPARPKRRKNSRRR